MHTENELVVVSYSYWAVLKLAIKLILISNSASITVIMVTIFVQTIFFTDYILYLSKRKIMRKDTRIAILPLTYISILVYL